MTSRLPVRAMITLTRQLFLRGVCQVVINFARITLRSFLSTGTKPLYFIRLNSRMAPHFATRSIIGSTETKSKQLKSTLGQHNLEITNNLFSVNCADNCGLPFLRLFSPSGPHLT